MYLERFLSEFEAITVLFDAFTIDHIIFLCGWLGGFAFGFLWDIKDLKENLRRSLFA